MAYCKSCGAYIPDGITACLACGYDEAAKAQESSGTATAGKHEKKSGGAYVTVTGFAKKIDTFERVLMINDEIPLRILNLDLFQQTFRSNLYNTISAFLH